MYWYIKSHFHISRISINFVSQYPFQNIVIVIIAIFCSPSFASLVLSTFCIEPCHAVVYTGVLKGIHTRPSYAICDIYTSSSVMGEDQVLFLIMCVYRKHITSASFIRLIVGKLIQTYSTLFRVSASVTIKVILHQFWVKKFFPWKFNLEYGGTFTKLFMHVSSRNMLATIRNLQIRVHVYRSRHCCGDWLTFGCFVPMIADHASWRKDKQSWMLR
jgi:hypothetical protein